jgi:hypothetical protein
VRTVVGSGVTFFLWLWSTAAILLRQRRLLIRHRSAPIALFENTVLFYSGLVEPDVFNHTDLSMGDRWAVIERRDGERWDLVPFNGPAGERLDYHRSDLLCFSNSIQWRRAMIYVMDLEAYHRPGGGGYDYARRMALYDHRRHGGSGIYRVTLYRNHASEYARGSESVRYEPAQVLEFMLQVGTEKP